MGLGGVAIAVLPSVVYPQTVVLGQAGGGEFFRIAIYCMCFFDVCQSKMHSGCGVFPVSKAMVGGKKAMICRQQSYAILMVQHSCTVGAGLLH